MKCLNGLGPDGCEALFENSSLARRAIRYCAAKYVRDRLGNCAVGPLESLEYLGANAAGDDVYSAKTLSETDTTVIPPPGPNGRIAKWCTSGRPPESTFRPNCSDGHSTDSFIVKITARPDHAIILYTRPQDRAQLLPSAAGAIRPEIAQHLARVQSLYDHGFFLGALKQIEVAEAVPNQSDEEKATLAQAKTKLLGNGSVTDNNPFQTWMSGPQQSLGNEALPPGDQIQCPNCGIGTPKAN